MHVFIRNLKSTVLGLVLAVGIPAVADDFADIAGYDEVSIEADGAADPEVAQDIQDAVDFNPVESSEAQMAGATPEPEYNAGMSELANKMSKKKGLKKAKKASKKIAKAKTKTKKGKAKKRTIAKF